MKIRQQKDLDKPINFHPGDTLEIAYTEPGSSKERVLLREQLKEHMIVNYVAAVELEDAELSQLGLEQGLAGIFGHKNHGS